MGTDAVGQVPQEAERELAGAVGLLDSLDPLIHEPSRFGILRVLCAGDPEATRDELRRATGLGRQNLHNHLRKLEGAGYVRSREVFRGKGSVRVASTTAVGEHAFRAYIEDMMSVEASSRPPPREGSDREATPRSGRREPKARESVEASSGTQEVTSNVSVLDKALSRARDEETKRSATRREEERRRERERAERKRWFADAVAPYVRPASPSDYRRWLEGYVGAGGVLTHYYDRDMDKDFLAATPGSAIVLRPLHGANAVHLIVPAGARVEAPEGLGHSVLYFMDGFEVRGRHWVPGYRDLAERRAGNGEKA